MRLAAALNSATDRKSRANKLSKAVVGALHRIRLRQQFLGPAIHVLAEGARTIAARHARVLKVIPQSGSADRVTIYAGEIEVDETGTWTKYVHDDVKRTGNGGAAQKFFHHRDHLKTIKIITNASGAEVRRTTYAPFGHATHPFIIFAISPPVGALAANVNVPLSFTSAIASSSPA